MSACCYPIVLRNGAGYLARADVEKTLRPVLAPPKNRRRCGKQNITIDPGHGGKDPGFQVGPNQEKKYTLLLAPELRDQLKRAGFNVSLTRTTDKAVDKHERPVIARRQARTCSSACIGIPSPPARRRSRARKLIA